MLYRTERVSRGEIYLLSTVTESDIHRTVEIDLEIQIEGGEEVAECHPDQLFKERRHVHLGIFVFEFLQIIEEGILVDLFIFPREPDKFAHDLEEISVFFVIDGQVPFQAVLRTLDSKDLGKERFTRCIYVPKRYEELRENAFLFASAEEAQVTVASAG